MTATATFTFPPTQYSVEAGLVADTLSKLDEGETVTYESLSKSAGINILKFRNVLNSARRTLQKEQQKVYKAVNGVGMIRLDNEQLAGHGIESIKRIGRAARRAIKVTSAADYDRLSPQGKVRQMQGMSVLNLMQHASSGSTLKKIATSTTNARVLPLESTIQFLGA